jgi:two-component system, NtrC family, response regulator AtoC
MKIIIIEDEKSIRISLELSLQKLGIDILTAETGEEGIELIKQHKPEIAIVDIKLPGIDGIEVLKKTKKLNKKCLVIMITYLSEVRLAVKSMKMGAYDYYTKPFSLKEINDVVINARKYFKLRGELESKKEEDNQLIGKSEAILNIKEKITKINKININTCIMIQGESGTGKDIIAKLIYNSRTKNSNFVVLNCAAIPKTLQESEFFGYEKGAFTGAKDTKIGLIEKSNNGVLFLDEIGDMDIKLQAKVLRALQEKKIRRIGSFEEKSFDAMIISATNKDLKKEINKGNFREDLYYRLNIVPIYIPPLRERKEDILPLIEHFIKYYNNKLDKKILNIDNKALEVFMYFNWPGNVRELKNIIERIMIFIEGNKITIDDLPEEIFIDYDSCVSNQSKLELAERNTILNCLIKYNWNITKTSEELGISRITVRRKIQKYDIKKND